MCDLFLDHSSLISCEYISVWRRRRRKKPFGLSHCVFASFFLPINSFSLSFHSDCNRLRARIDYYHHWSIASLLGCYKEIMRNSRRTRRLREKKYTEIIIITWWRVQGVDAKWVCTCTPIYNNRTSIARFFFRLASEIVDGQCHRTINQIDHRYIAAA